MPEDIGDLFQEETRYNRAKMTRHSLDWKNQPEPFKLYPDVAFFELPVPEKQSGPGLWQILQNRRSQRGYKSQNLTLQQLSQLLWAIQGVTAQQGQYYFRTAPSAGALYPIETYLMISRIDGLEPGVYHYAVTQHGLEQLKAGDFASEAAQAALDQSMVRTAPVTFIWTAIFQRSKWKYRQRAYRYIYLDAGHIAQNLALAAVGMGLGSCQIAALYDDEVNRLIEVDGKEESVVYMSVVGVV
ncbi:SagB/ThcOx family dehydrogenase [candidate division KSB1 bacterium]|nr:SagB/ThcOx family dehydrogenase [candidate division KSB1 bacterium]